MDVSAGELEEVLQELVVATTVDSPESASLFPQDLVATSNILDMTVGFLWQTLTTEDPFPLSTVSSPN